MSNFHPKFYQEIPSEDELEEQLRRFIETFGENLFKCGVTTRAYLRYGEKDFWRKITDLDHFAYCCDFEIARKIEQMMIETLKKLDKYKEHQDSTSGHKAEEKSDFVIYLVTGKSEDDRCPICGKVWIEGQMKRQEHLDHHMKEKMSWEYILKMGEETKDEQMIKDAKSILEWPSRGVADETETKKQKLN